MAGSPEINRRVSALTAEEGEAPYLGELFYEQLPERGLSTRRLGATALSLAASGTYAQVSQTVPEDDLPSFEAYLAAKYPYLSADATDELVARFQALADRHGIDTDRTVRRHQR